MRLNQFLARYSELSRRGADREIELGNVVVNGQTATLGTNVELTDSVRLRGMIITPGSATMTVLFNKPAGYVCSRRGQGCDTIYDILPEKYHNLNPAGRLDKDSSGLLLLTNDGELAELLTHPRYQKTKKYTVTLDKPLEPLHQQMISDHGIVLEDGNSRLNLTKLDNQAKEFEVTMHEGRNRQIRRTFTALGYTVTELHRTQFGDYLLGVLPSGKTVVVAQS